MKVRNGRRFNFRQPPDLGDLADSEKKEDKVEKPILSSCCCCCSLPVGIIFGSIILIAFDLTFVVKKSQMMMADEDEDKIELPEIEKQLTIAYLVITISTVVGSLLLLLAGCLFAVPDKLSAMKFVGRIWIAIAAVSTLWKLFESTYNTLPQEDFDFVISMPEFDVDDITGVKAIIVTWAFTAFYLIVYILLAIIVTSQITVLQMMVSLRAQNQKLNRNYFY